MSYVPHRVMDDLATGFFFHPFGVVGKPILTCSNGFCNATEMDTPVFLTR